MCMHWRGDGLNEGSREFTLKEDTKNMTRSQAERTGPLESRSAQGEAKAGGSMGRAWPINQRGAITALRTGITFRAALGVSERWQPEGRKEKDGQ